LGALDAIADMDADEGIDFVGFYPKELYGTSYIWSPDAARNEEIALRFGHDATILPSENSAILPFQGSLRNRQSSLY